MFVSRLRVVATTIYPIQLMISYAAVLISVSSSAMFHVISGNQGYNQQQQTYNQQPAAAQPQQQSNYSANSAGDGYQQSGYQQQGQQQQTYNQQGTFMRVTSHGHFRSDVP